MLWYGDPMAAVDYKAKIQAEIASLETSLKHVLDQRDFVDARIQAIRTEIHRLLHAYNQPYLEPIDNEPVDWRPEPDIS